MSDSSQKEFIERRIVTGLIVSDAYIAKVSEIWDPAYIVSESALIISKWCLWYFSKYGKAPGREIESIYMHEESKLSKDLSEEIKNDILPSLSDEYVRGAKFNVQYLIDHTLDYFKIRRLDLHTEEVQFLTDQGRVDEAEALAREYRNSPTGERYYIDLGSDESLERMRRAFSKDLQSVATYPGALGSMLNPQFVRGGFVAFLAPEKRGKSFILLDIGMRALKDYSNVVFFQAGDMNESQQLRRIGMYLSKKPERDYGDFMYVPVLDCFLNQNDSCVRDEREGIVGLDFEDRKDVNFDALVERVEDKKFSDYLPCRNCSYGIYNEGSVYYVKKDPGLVSDVSAEKVAKSFFRRYRNRFRLSSFVNGELSVSRIRGFLDAWETEDGFVPDVVIVDYADLLVNGAKGDFRHKVDDVWKALRALSQERHCLVVTATQSDAKSYDQNRLKLSNFSEDKRKYAHVTAMYGLNQDATGAEKKMGLLRINEMVVRDGSFSERNEVFVLQQLDLCRPYLGSFRRKFTKKS